MTRKIIIREIIREKIGLKTFTPSDELLKKLNGMSNKRFGQILNNNLKEDLSWIEKEMLEEWLREAFNDSNIEIFDKKVRQRNASHVQ